MLCINIPITSAEILLSILIVHIFALPCCILWIECRPWKQRLYTFLLLYTLGWFVQPVIRFVYSVYTSIKRNHKHREAYFTASTQVVYIEIIWFLQLYYILCALLALVIQLVYYFVRIYTARYGGIGCSILFYIRIYVRMLEYIYTPIYLYIYYNMMMYDSMLNVFVLHYIQSTYTLVSFIYWVM